MSFSKYRKPFIKKPSPATRAMIHNLKRQNAFLLRTLSELGHRHSDLNRIIERLLALVPLRPSRHNTEDSGCPPGGSAAKSQCHVFGVSLQRVSCYCKEMEEIKDELVTISARCQHLEGNTREKESSADALVIRLQTKLQDALDKNQQWVEYDVQREDYVESLLAKVAWLESHLREISSDRSDFILNEKKKIRQMEEYFEELTHNITQELEILREQDRLTQQALAEARRDCRLKQYELEELRQQDPPQIREVLTEAEDLQSILDKERRKSATLELQSSHLQKYFLNDYHKAQEQITKMKRMIDTLLQDLHAEKDNCTNLRRQLEAAQRQTKEKERDKKADCGLHVSADRLDRSPPPPEVRHPRSPRTSLIDETFMVCPSCHERYPSSRYNDLIEHLDYCHH